MASGLMPWPSIRHTLFVHQIDKIASESPNTLYAILPVSSDNVEDGFREITYRQLGNAVNGIAAWIEETLGKSNDGTFPTLTYFGPNDLRHTILLFGAVKAGYKMLFPSPRYSAQSLAALIALLEGDTLLLADGQERLAEQILAHRRIRLHKIPTLADLLNIQYPHYAYEKTFDQARSEPLLVLHTSGTTGFPKPIVWTHDWADSFSAERSLDPPMGCESMDAHLLGTRVLSLMPPFHASGMFGSVFFSLCRGSVMIYPPSALLPSAAIAAQILKHVEADIIAMPAPFLEVMGSDPALLNNIASRIKYVMYAGGDLETSTGESVSPRIRLFTACGSTEMGLWPILARKDVWKADDWHFMHLHPAMNMKMNRVPGLEGIFEAVIEKNEELPGKDSYVQPIFRLFPDLQKYHTSDLFTPHWSNPNLWKFYGRTDDLQTFSTGEKFHPVTFESLVARHPDVDEALLVGTGLPQAILLLRLRSEGLVDMESVWPIINEANKMCPTYAVITRKTVLQVDKPFPKTAKGTIQRKATLELYREKVIEIVNSLEQLE